MNAVWLCFKNLQSIFYNSVYYMPINYYAIAGDRSISAVVNYKSLFKMMLWTVDTDSLLPWADLQQNEQTAHMQKTQCFIGASEHKNNAM